MGIGIEKRQTLTVFNEERQHVMNPKHVATKLVLSAVFLFLVTVIVGVF